MRSEPHVTQGRRLFALVVCALLLGAASVGLDAATAHAATVGRQVTVGPPARFPIDFAGRAWSRGQTIPAGYAMLRRRVAMKAGERRRTVYFTCPAGTVAFEPGLPDVSAIGINVRDVFQYHHPRRRFRLAVWPAPAEQLRGPVARGPVYFLCGPRSELPGR
jgi:hypothetical protein